MTGSRGPKVYLSKSLYVRGLQCLKSLYLDRYFPEALAARRRRPGSAFSRWGTMSVRSAGGFFPAALKSLMKN